MSEQEVLDGLRRIIEEITGIPASNVTPDSNFVDDLDIDSLSMVEVALAAQDTFGVEIPDERLKELPTVKSAVAFIQG
jgi:acyl carrier protein